MVDIVETFLNTVLLYWHAEYIPSHRTEMLDSNSNSAMSCSGLVNLFTVWSRHLTCMVKTCTLSTFTTYGSHPIGFLWPADSRHLKKCSKAAVLTTQHWPHHTLKLASLVMYFKAWYILWFTSFIPCSAHPPWVWKPFHFVLSHYNFRLI